MAVYGATSAAGGGFNPYAAGVKVYNGGSPQPTSGTVDPTGYIQREVNNSQSRSGLAQAALDRIKAMSAGNVAPGQLLPGPPGSFDPLNGIQLHGQPIINAPILHGTPIVTPGGPIPVNVPGGVGSQPIKLHGEPIIYGGTPIQELPGPTGTIAPVNTQPGNSGQAPGQQQPGPGGVLSPIVKPLQINDLGQITLPQSQTLSLDADLVGQIAAGTQSAQQQLAALQQQQQQISQQYATNARQAVNAEPDVLNQLLNGFAGRGLAHSSGYGEGVTNEQDRYMQGLDQLFTTSQNGLNNLVSQANQVPTTLQSLIAQLQGTQAQRNIAAAGTLNLDQTLANLMNPDTNKQFVAVANDIDKQEALKAGFSLDQLVNAPGSTATGLGNIPGSATNVIYAGAAGSKAPAGAKTAVGADRNSTEQMLEQLLNKSGGGTAPAPKASAPAPTAGYNHLSSFNGLKPGTALYAVINGQMTHLSPAQLAGLTPGTAVYTK